MASAMHNKVDAEIELDFGFNIYRLADVFGVNIKDAKRFMKGVEPDDTRNEQPIWLIRTAAPYLMSLENVDIEPRLRKMNPNDLPAALSKELWTAMLQRQKYYANRGDTWATGRVYDVVMNIMKIVRNTSRLFVSSLDGKLELSNKLRDALQTEMDKMMQEVRDRINDEFSEYDPTKDHGDRLEDIYAKRSDDTDTADAFGRSSEILSATSFAEEDDSWLDNL